MDRADGALEILDRPVALADRVASLADIDRLNAWFGGYALTLREIRRVVAAVPGGDALVAVDVGGGHAAFGVRLVDWARGARRAIRVVVVDRDVETLALARRACAAYPEISLVVADATALPLREGAADVVTSAPTLPHLEPGAADVIVVGAGPAGAATAILLAEHGVAVQLLDRARFPRPKICGEYLSPEAPRVLDRLGVLKTVDGLATPLAGIRITAPDGTVV